MLFTVTPHRLPHDGIIPGARGHKKVVVPRGTTVYTIEYGHLKFWAAYLDRDTALTVAQSLDDTATGRSRRSIALPTLLAWNFKSAIPRRISRPGTKWGNA